MTDKIIKLFLRISISFGFLSAVADRFGFWGQEVSAWGNWNSFLTYTALINPWLPASMISTIAILATTAEMVFAVCLLIGYKTEFFARLSGILLMIFGLAMTFSVGIKPVLDYSVFIASAAAFGLSLMKFKCFEVDSMISIPRTEK